MTSPTEEEEKDTTVGRDRASTRIKFIQHKTDAWVNFDVNIMEINTKDQTFGINAHINVFWHDKHFVDDVLRPHEVKQESWNKENQYIRNYNYDDFSSLFRNYRLPLNVHKLFENTVQEDSSPKEDFQIWINPQTKDLHIYIKFQGSLSEHLECDDFPFDAQFLNMQLVYDMRHYSFTADCPWYVYMKSPFPYHLPITVKKSSSITQWKLLSPWIDLSEHKILLPADESHDVVHNKNASPRDGSKNQMLQSQEDSNAVSPKIPFALIKLRVRRDPNYYLLYAVFPSVLIISSSFAVISVDPEDIGDRLEFITTLLLTVTAFQYAISAELPDSPMLTNVDKIILMGYLIECMFILYVSISATWIDHEDVVDKIELILPTILFVIWALCCFFFVIYPYYQYRNGVDWIAKANDEYEQFDVNHDRDDYVAEMQDGDLFRGTNDGGKVVGKKELKCYYVDERGPDPKTGRDVRFLQINQAANVEDIHPEAELLKKEVLRTQMFK